MLHCWDFHSQSRRFWQKFLQKSQKYEILMDFNRNLTIFQIKDTNFNYEFSPNHESKKYETSNYKKWIISTFEVCFQKIFWRRSRSDLDFLSWSMKFLQKSKKFNILMDFNQNLIIFEIKETRFHNEFCLNHVSKKYETNDFRKKIACTFEIYYHKIFWRRGRSDFAFSSWSMKF